MSEVCEKEVIPIATKSKHFINKFLSDPRITPEQKMLCVRLSTNPLIEQLIEKTPIHEVFEICDEYKKNPNLYDDIFNGNVKLVFIDSDSEPTPIFTPDKITEKSNLKMFFGSDTLIGEVVEKFIACEDKTNKINRITIKLRDENKIYIAGFTKEQKMASLIIDTIADRNANDIIIDFLNMTKNKRLDIIRN